MRHCNYREACAVRAMKTWNNRDVNLYSAFSLLLLYSIMGAVLERKKLQACVLEEVSLKVFQNRLIFDVLGISAKDSSSVSEGSLLNLLL